MKVSTHSAASSKRRTVMMDEAIWSKAEHMSARLNLSVSQLLTRLVIETKPLIKNYSLLGLPHVSSSPES